MRNGADRLGNILGRYLKGFTAAVVLFSWQRLGPINCDPRMLLNLRQGNSPRRILGQHPDEQILELGRSTTRSTRWKFQSLMLDETVEGDDVRIVKWKDPVDEGIEGHAHRPNISRPTGELSHKSFGS